jgi:hypothetical protein
MPKIEEVDTNEFKASTVRKEIIDQYVPIFKQVDNLEQNRAIKLYPEAGEDISIINKNLRKVAKAINKDSDIGIKKQRSGESILMWKMSKEEKDRRKNKINSLRESRRRK